MSSAGTQGGRSIEVGILGATGMVGQQFVRLLAAHPWFKPTWLAASERSEGKPYREAATWRLASPIAGRRRAACTVDACTPGQRRRGSCSRRSTLGRRRGHRAGLRRRRPHRRQQRPQLPHGSADVPLLIPEVNADHLALIARQRRERGWSGAIVTNPNCSTVVLAMVAGAAAPVRPRRGDGDDAAGGLGRGLSRRASLDILGNVVPAISGEEEKIESETQKILGGSSATA